MRLNANEREMHPNGPRFRWTCSEDCLWIAIEIFSLEGNESNVQSKENNAIQEVSARF